MQALEAIDIRKDFTEGNDQPVVVLKGISLSLQCGEIVSLEGPSGSGKTTLLCILGCLLSPSQGKLFIDGKAIDPRNASLLTHVRRQCVGFVFQNANLFPSLSAVENVQYALNLKGQVGAAARREAERLLERVGLAARLHFLPGKLSAGQKQRVAIARALAGNCPIVLADEPTANLDWQTGNEVLELFRDLAREEQRALLMATHDPRIPRIADRTFHIHDGLLVP